MEVAGLKIPEELVGLIKEGRWPGKSEQVMGQESYSPIAKELIKQIAEEEEKIILYAPPFHTVESLCKRESSFWKHPSTAPDEIDFSKSIPIGDFGLGSDAPILLDYRKSSLFPSVIRLKWTPFARNNHWVLVSPAFEEFAFLLGLWNISFGKE